MMLTDRTIVIAEDNAVLRSVITEIFREYGWKVRNAENGFASLQAISEEMPAVLLSDLEMGGMSGFELLSIVRRRFPSIKVVAMSGSFAGSAVPAGVAADGFYAKGGSVAMLLDLVAEIRNKQVQTSRRGATPVWVSASLKGPCADGSLAVACSNCMRAMYLSPLQAQETQVSCPHCQNLVSVFMLYDSAYCDTTFPQLAGPRY